MHRLSAAREDTTAAALHILEQPKFTVFVPEHALTLGQNYALIYLLLPTDQNFWLGAVMKRLNRESETVAQKSLLLLLWYVQTSEADTAIASFAADTTRPASSRAYAEELMKRKDEIGPDFRSRASAISEAEIREKRQERMKAVSDEALIDLDDYTALLIAKRL